GRTHPGVRPPGAPGPGAELAVPDGQRAPAPAGVEGLRDQRRDPARRLDDRASGHRLRHRPGGARPRGTQHRPRAGNHRHQVLVCGPARRRRPAGAEAVMSRRTRLVLLLLAGTVLAAGCGSAARQPGPPAVAAPPPSLSTSLVTTTGTWAVAVMGGPAAEHNNFWQLFVRP